MRGIAKGARRSRRRFVNAFESHSVVQMTYREKKALIWIEACKLLEPHLALRTEIDRWGYAALATEIMLEMVPEGESQEGLFFLLRETLGQLSRDKDALNVLLLFLLRLMDVLGYLPALESCGECRRPIKEATKWNWRLSQGKLICAEHRAPSDGSILLDLGTLLLMQQCRRLPLERMWRLRLIQGKKLPLLRGLVDWIRDHTRGDLNSLRLLEQIRSVG